MNWQKVKLKEVLKQYRVQHIVQDDIEYKQVTISKYDGVTFRGTKIGKDIGRKRQFIIDLKNYPNTLMLVRQGVQDGSIGIAPLEVDGCIATENMPMFSVEGIDLEYLRFLLKSPYFYDELNKIETTGSAQKSIHERQILEIEIPLPNLEEQKQFVAELTKLKNGGLEISSELTHQLDLIMQLRQAFLREAMQGKLVKSRNAEETGKQLLEKIKAEKAQLIAEKKLKKEKELPTITEDEIPFEIPEHWAWCRLGETGELKRGKSKHRPRNDENLFLNGKYPFIQTGDVSRSKTNGYLINTINGYYNDFGLAQSEMQKEGTLCITIAANIAECGFLGFDACTPDSIVDYVSIDKIIEKFVFYYLIDAKEEIEKYAPATAQKNINLGILNDLKIPFPPLHEQELIVAKLEELMAFCDGLEQSIKESQGYNEKLLQQVLRVALQPKTQPKLVALESRKLALPLKTILGAYIVDVCNTIDFGRVKFQKLLFLAEYHCKIDFDSHYVQKAAGPHDDTLIKSIEEEFKRQRFFEVKQENSDNHRVRYTKLPNAAQINTMFLENFSDESLKVNNLLMKMRTFNWEECEVVATIYAVWNNRLLKGQTITDDFLFEDFMAWSPRKSNFKNDFYKKLFWMKEENIVPDGWGKYVEKHDKKMA